MINLFFLSALCNPVFLKVEKLDGVATGKGTVFARGGGSLTASVDTLNNTLKGFAGAIGAVLIAVAVLKYIMSIASENSQEKMNASLMFGGGIFFTSMSAVLTTLGMSDLAEASASGVATKICSVLGSLTTYAGAGLLALAVFMFIMAIAQENPDQQNKASTLLGISVAFLSFSSVAKKFASKAIGGLRPDLVNFLISTIASVATYIGGGVLLFAIFKLVISIRDEQSQDRHKAGIMFGVAVSLLSFRVILRLFGLSA